MLDDIRKSRPRPGQNAATKHEDYLMQTRMYRAGTGTPTYLRVVCSAAKPDKPEHYAAVLKKMLVPTFDEQIKQGAATYYGFDEQYVNTSAPSTRCLVITYPNAKASTSGLQLSTPKWANGRPRNAKNSQVPPCQTAGATSWLG